MACDAGAKPERPSQQSLPRYFIVNCPPERPAGQALQLQVRYLQKPSAALVHFVSWGGPESRLPTVSHCLLAADTPNIKNHFSRLLLPSRTLATGHCHGVAADARLTKDFADDLQESLPSSPSPQISDNHHSAPFTALQRRRHRSLSISLYCH